MRSKINFGLLIICQLLFGIAHTQDTVNPWNNENQNSTINGFHQDGQLGETAGFHGEFEIFHSGSNSDVPKESNLFSQLDPKHNYYVLPKLDIQAISTPISTSTGSTLEVTIRAKYPSFKEAARYLQNTLTKEKVVSTSEVMPIKIFGYKVTDRVTGIHYFTPSNAGNTITANTILVATLSYYSLDEAQIARDRILQGQSLDFTCMLNQRSLLGGCDFLISGEEILNSRAYRDFVSPVEGQVISIEQAAQISNNIANSLDNQFQCKGRTPEYIKALAIDVFNGLFTSRRLISFEELQAAGYLINLDGARYQPDVINKLLLKTTQDDLSKWNRNQESKYDKKKETLVNTEAKGGALWGLVKGDAKFKTDIDRSLFKKLINNNEGEYRTKNSFEFEFNGNKVIPKGMYVHEVITSKAEFKTHFTGTFTQYMQKYNTRTTPIRFTH